MLSSHPQMHEIMVGIILKPHGLRGLVKVRPTTDHPERYRQLGRVGLYSQGKLLGDFQVERAEIQEHSLLVKFQGLDSCEAVEPLRGAEIRIPHNERLPTNDRQFYHFDLIGLSVHTVTGSRIGRIVEILENPGNDVWVIRDDNDREHLVPAIDSVIKAVRLEQRQVIIAPMPGLLDDLSDEPIE